MKPRAWGQDGQVAKRSIFAAGAPRSYLVDVEGTLYRRNRVDLRPAESNTATTEQHRAQHDSPPVGRPEDTPDNATDTNNDTATVSQQVRPHRWSDVHQPQAGSPPPISVPGHRTASGRLVKVPNRLDL